MAEQEEAVPAAELATPVPTEEEPAAAPAKNHVTFGADTTVEGGAAPEAGGEAGASDSTSVESTPAPEESEAGEEPEKEGMLEFMRHVTREWPLEMKKELLKVPSTMREIATKLHVAALNPCSTCSPTAAPPPLVEAAESPEKGGGPRGL